MKILSVESSSLVASVALLEDELIIAEYSINCGLTHSQTLLPMLDEIVKRTGTGLEDIDAIAISGGPGSFTGLRIGVATAKGLGLGLSKPLIHIPTLDATAYNIYGVDALICPIMDARRSQVYTGIYKHQYDFEVVMESKPMDIRELLATLSTYRQRVLFLGDGVPVYKEIIEKEADFEYSFVPPNNNRQRAASVAALAALYFKEGKTVDADLMQPEYLRLSQAERERSDG